MRIIALSGPSGSGKSTALKQLGARYPLMTADYASSEKLGASGDLIGSKFGYLFAWYSEVTRKAPSGYETLICDRSPIDCAAYVKHGRSELLRVIYLAMKELRDSEVFVHHVLVNAEASTLIERIEKRERGETANYRGQVSLSMIEASLQFYAEKSALWDRVVDTTDLSKSEATQKILDAVNMITLGAENLRQ